MNSYIDELFKTGKYGDNYVISVPIKLITNKYPIFDELWSQFKGMCNYGTNQQNQVELINKIIDNDKYLTTFRKDVMKYPDKEMYNSFELNSTIKDKTVKIFTLPYNDVWRVTNGKYQHLVNNVSFPSYYWSKDKLQILTDLGVEARGNFYYPKGAFREWHTNAKNISGFRMYFIAKNEGNSWFNYINPETNKVVNLPDKNEYANIFYVHNYQNWDKVIWHSIYSETDRFSLGFNFKPK